jgi:chemotaxis protein MotB
MPRLASLALAALCALSACGITEPESNRLVQSALAEQRKVYEVQLRRMREDYGDQIKGGLERVDALEAALKELGIDVTAAKDELGSQLRSTTMAIEELRRQHQRAEQEAAAFRTLAERFKAMVDAGKIQVITRNGRMTLKMPDKILFPTGSTAILNEGQQTLKAVVEILKSVPDREFLIAGHTDNVPVKSARFRSNWDLSTARAVEVVNLMVANGVQPDRLAAAGYGEYDPIADNADPAGREQNRRLEIVVMPKLQDVSTIAVDGAH